MIGGEETGLNDERDLSGTLSLLIFQYIIYFSLASPPCYQNTREGMVVLHLKQAVIIITRYLSWAKLPRIMLDSVLVYVRDRAQFEL